MVEENALLELAYGAKAAAGMAAREQERWRKAEQAATVVMRLVSDLVEGTEPEADESVPCTFLINGMNTVRHGDEELETIERMETLTADQVIGAERQPCPECEAEALLIGTHRDEGEGRRSVRVFSVCAQCVRATPVAEARGGTGLLMALLFEDGEP